METHIHSHFLLQIYTKFSSNLHYLWMETDYCLFKLLMEKLPFQLTIHNNITITIVMLFVFVSSICIFKQYV